MKIQLVVTEDSNDMEIHELIIDGKSHERICDLSECPEDAHIGRDLIDGTDIIGYMQRAYEAGKAGEPLEIEYIDGEGD